MSAYPKSQWAMRSLIFFCLMGLITKGNAQVTATDVCPIFFTTASLLSCPFNRDPVCNLVYYLLLINRCISYSTQKNGALRWPDVDEQAQPMLSLLDQNKADSDTKENDPAQIDPDENREFLKYIM